MRFSYLFSLSLIDLVPKKDTVSYKFNFEPNRAREHLAGAGRWGAVGSYTMRAIMAGYTYKAIY